MAVGKKEYRMVVGSLAGVAVFYEMVSLAHRGQLDKSFHSPTDVILGAACLLFFGWALALVAPRVGRSFGVFTATGGAAAAAIAGSGSESTYSMPLFCVVAAALLMVWASYRGDRQERRARTT